MSNLVRVLLLVTAVWAGAGLVSAQQQPKIEPGKVPGQYIITDAAGRIHVRNPKITDAQRKAVAKRMTAARIKAARKNGK